ncbi:uncharacterized protein [Parasteatoda tepidariorum]|uniref:uncharacterized protein n=1 Tax=Parasteatoda tepidariorum TaxID=114398 RepID=UPI00077FAC0D|nr:uncharacterized protein LOC107448837 [Parasteatoda tepidariorum]
MKWFSGLVLCLVIGLAYSQEDEDVDYLSPYYCYLDKVFQYKWNADYSGGWCQHEPKIAKYQIQAAEECKTGFADTARKYHDNLSAVCSNDLKDIEGDCDSMMFTDPGEECFADYFAEYQKPGANPFDVVAMERALCKHFDKMMTCHYTKIAERCKNYYHLFLRVMEPYRELQHSVCAIIPSP